MRLFSFYDPPSHVNELSNAAIGPGNIFGLVQGIDVPNKTEEMRTSSIPLSTETSTLSFAVILYLYCPL
jgi:hypothetical protein